jgi:hypothetical protein
MTPSLQEMDASAARNVRSALRLVTIFGSGREEYRKARDITRCRPCVGLRFYLNLAKGTTLTVSLKPTYYTGRFPFMRRSCSHSQMSRDKINQFKISISYY